jgi:sulfur carrier protein ThiS
MKVLFINNEGGGFAAHIEIEPNTTIQGLFEQRIKASHPEDYLIRVNRLPVAADYVLQENDRVTITPTKIEGADR